jgi:hypothetical protein
MSFECFKTYPEAIVRVQLTQQSGQAPNHLIKSGFNAAFTWSLGDCVKFVYTIGSALALAVG